MGLVTPEVGLGVRSPHMYSEVCWRYAWRTVLQKPVLRRYAWRSDLRKSAWRPVLSVCIISIVRDNAFENYLGHDIDLSWSRDIINDVIIRSAIGHFLLVGNWYQACISNRFRDIGIEI